jgi:transposase-like protein
MERERTPKTWGDALRCFSDPDECVRMIAGARWPGGVRCPRCGGRRVRYITTRRLWECATRHKKRQFSVRSGTVFEDSAVRLDKWLAVIWMLANARRRISSRQIQRAVGVTQKTAWRMLRRASFAAGPQGLVAWSIVPARVGAARFAEAPGSSGGTSPGLLRDLAYDTDVGAGTTNILHERRNLNAESAGPSRGGGISL